jgi:hypothetical protein
VVVKTPSIRSSISLYYYQDVSISSPHSMCIITKVLLSPGGVNACRSSQDLAKNH